MKLYYRLIAFFLALVAVGGSFVACGNGKEPLTTDEQESIIDKQESTTESKEIVADSAEVTTDIEDLLSISKNDYDTDFLLWIMKDTNEVRYHWVEESKNDVLSQAIYTRQQNVLAYLGVNIIGKELSDYQEYATPFKTAVKNKDGSVDTMLCHVYASVPTLVSENYLTDISTLPGINIDADYWNQEFMTDLALDGRYFLGFSDFNILYTHVITFNKDLMEKYGDSLDKSVYDMVRAKEWTVDQMILLANLVYIDQTSDGKSVDDIFGITGLHQNEFTGFLHASGIKIVEQDSTGEYTVALMNDKNKEKTVALVDKLCNLCASDCSYFDYRKFSSPSVSLTSDRTLMHLNRTSALEGYLNYDISFGVLPYPLWDSEQDDYHHLQWGGYITVPAYLRDTQMASETLEMLSYYSADVKTAYYEKMLGKQVADVPDDSQMLAIVWDTVCTDIAQTYCQTLGGTDLLYMLSTVTESNSGANIASTVAKLERTANTAIKKYIRKVEANKG